MKLAETLTVFLSPLFVVRVHHDANVSREVSREHGRAADKQKFLLRFLEAFFSDMSLEKAFLVTAAAGGASG